MFVIKIICFVIAIIALVLFTIAARKSKKGIATMFLITYIFFWGLLCYSTYIELIYSRDAVSIVTKSDTKTSPPPTRNPGVDNGNPDVTTKKSKGEIVGNKDSMIYHVPGSTYYDKAKKKESNNEYFDTEEEAIKAGYRAPKR